MNIEDKDLIKQLNRLEEKKKQIRDDINYVNRLQDEYLKKRKKNIISITSLVSIAAILVLYICIIAPSTGKINYSELFTEYFTPLESDIMVRGEISELSLKSKAVILYDNKDYYKAEIIIDSLLLNTPDDATLNLYKGLIELNNKHIADAKEILANNLTSGGALRVQTRWYLALIGLLENKPDDAKEHLKILKKNKEKPYKSEVKSLLRKLRFRKTK